MSTEDKIRKLAEDAGVDAEPLLDALEQVRKEADCWGSRDALIASGEPGDAVDQRKKAHKALDSMSLRAKAMVHSNLFHILSDEMELDAIAMQRLAQVDLLGCVAEALVGTTEDDLADKETWDKPRLYRDLTRAWTRVWTSSEYADDLLEDAEEKEELIRAWTRVASDRKYRNDLLEAPEKRDSIIWYTNGLLDFVRFVLSDVEKEKLTRAAVRLRLTRSLTPHA